jgi:hypothetical protein
MTTTRKPGSKKTDLIARTVEAAAENQSARLAELSGLIQRKIVAIDEAFYDIGLALREVSQRRLFRAPDAATAKAFTTFDAWLAAKGFMKRSVAYELIAIVDGTTRDDALRMGMTKAYALVQYARATPAPDSAGELLAGGSIGGAPVAKASARAIEAAARAERAKQPTAAAKARAKADAATEKRLRARLRAAKLKPASVKVGKDTVTVVLPRGAVDEA